MTSVSAADRQRFFGIANDLSDGRRDAVQGEGLPKDAQRAQAEQLSFSVIAAIAAHKAGANIRINVLKATQRVRSVQANHADVEQHEGDGALVFPVNIQRVEAVIGLPDLKALMLQGSTQKIPDTGFVIDDEDSGITQRICERPPHSIGEAIRSARKGMLMRSIRWC